MHGPVWNDPNKGVTGERVIKPANTVTVTDARGKRITLVGAAADAYRATQGGVNA